MTWFPRSKRLIIHALLLAAAWGAAGPLHAAPKPPQIGMASWHVPTGGGCHTASHRRWVNTEMVAAHRTLPLGSKVRVVNLANGRDVVVQITDRGPYCRGRIIDVSRVAAQQLGLIASGTARVRLEVVPTETTTPTPVEMLVAMRGGPMMD